VRHLLHRLLATKTGVTAIEYALVASHDRVVIIVPGFAWHASRGQIHVHHRRFQLRALALRKLNAGNFNLMGTPLSVFSRGTCPPHDATSCDEPNRQAARL